MLVKRQDHLLAAFRSSIPFAFLDLVRSLLHRALLHRSLSFHAFLIHRRRPVWVVCHWRVGQPLP